MVSAAAAVPGAYTFFFKYLDPLIALGGVHLNFMDPSAAVTSMAPNSTYDPNQVFLFHHSGGLALAVALICATLPRYSDDVGVWRIFHFGLLLSDFAGLSGVYHAMERQRRLQPASWTSDDMGCGGIYIFVTLVRLCFVLGIVFRKAGSGTKMTV